MDSLGRTIGNVFEFSLPMVFISVVVLASLRIFLEQLVRTMGRPFYKYPKSHYWYIVHQDEPFVRTYHNESAADFRPIHKRFAEIGMFDTVYDKTF